jgi:hypothetical protein
VNIYSGTPGAAIRFDACSGLFCLDKDLYVRDSLFIRCGSNGGNGGAIWFNADDVTMERNAIFDCGTIKSNTAVSRSFGYFNIDDSNFDQITVVRTSPDDEHVHYVNELSGAKHYAVFHLYMDPEDPYICRRINQTDCYGTHYSPCFELQDGSNKCELSQSIFVHCICNNANSRGLIYVYDTKAFLYFKINNVYFVDCESIPNSVNYGCISTNSAGVLGSANVYFIRCTMKALINKEAGGYSFSNYFKYSCTISQDSIGSPSGTITDGGSNAPKEKMEGLITTIPFPHLAKIYEPSYTSFYSDIDISDTFTPLSSLTQTNSFSSSGHFSATLKFSQSGAFTKSNSFRKSIKFSLTVPLTKSFQFEKTHLFTRSSLLTNSKILSSTVKFTPLPFSTINNSDSNDNFTSRYWIIILVIIIIFSIIIISFIGIMIYRHFAAAKLNHGLLSEAETQNDFEDYVEEKFDDDFNFIDV